MEFIAGFGIGAFCMFFFLAVCMGISGADIVYKDDHDVPPKPDPSITPVTVRGNYPVALFTNEHGEEYEGAAAHEVYNKIMDGFYDKWLTDMGIKHD